MAHEDHSHGHAHTSADDQYRETPAGAGHEHTDVSVRLLVRFGWWLALTVVVTHIGLGLVFVYLVQQREEVDEPRYPLAVTDVPRLPPEPRLQRFPRLDMERFRQHEDALLSGYGWVDRDAGLVRIPIDEAMRLTIERGLPAREENAVRAIDEPGMVPSGSSSGRALERQWR